MNNILLETKNIYKNFQAVQALKGIDIFINKGEVRALVGENGAGKSTLVKILAGAIKPDKGQISINGKDVFFLNPKSAIENGVSVIYQELDLVPQLNGVSNIFLGFELKHKIWKTVDKKKMLESAKGYLEKMQAKIDLTKPVSNLPIAEQQIIAICKALAHEAKIIMMDEPSASLSSSELSRLFELIRELKKHEMTVIYISHRMEEIFEIADSVTVLRDGNLISTDEIKSVTKSEIIEKMIGKKLSEERINSRNYKNDDAILNVKNLYYKNNLKNISFDVKKGEIFGILGLVGSGRLELARILSGIYKTKQGDILLNNKKVKFKLPSDAISNSISYVPDERRTQGLFMNLSVLMNSIMMSISKMSNKIGIFNKKIFNKSFEKYKEKLQIKCSSSNQQVSTLSGGNQQKVVFAKCLMRDTDIIILNEPTKGIDVGSKFEIHRILLEIAEQNKTIVVFSPEIPEICSICDRIMILKRGEISKIFESGEINQQDVFKELLS